MLLSLKRIHLIFISLPSLLKRDKQDNRVDNFLLFPKFLFRTVKISAANDVSHTWRVAYKATSSSLDGCIHISATTQKMHKDILSGAFKQNNALNRTGLVVFAGNFAVFLIKTMADLRRNHNSGCTSPKISIKRFVPLSKAGDEVLLDGFCARWKNGCDVCKRPNLGLETAHFHRV